MRTGTIILHNAGQGNGREGVLVAFDFEICDDK